MVQLYVRVTFCACYRVLSKEVLLFAVQPPRTQRHAGERERASELTTERRRQEGSSISAIITAKHPLRRDSPNFRGMYRAFAYVRTCARTSRTFGVPFGSVSPFAGATTCWPWKSATTRDGRCLKSDARFIYSRGSVAGANMCICVLRVCIHTRMTLCRANASPIHETHA